LKDLQELFAVGFLNKIRTAPTRHEKPGRHYFGKSHGVGVNKTPQVSRPAGGKLAKRFNKPMWSRARDEKQRVDEIARDEKQRVDEIARDEDAKLRRAAMRRVAV
jgi:hypothetical protein